MAGRITVSNLVATVTAACAVLVTILVARRELFSSPSTSAIAPPSQPVPVQNWDSISGFGNRTGIESATVTIVEFADFECSVCRRFAISSLKGIRTNYGDRVALVFRHWPLPYHRFAYPAARASECAADQGRFYAFHDLLFLKQDSLGLKPWEAFAREAGVQDIRRFSDCTAIAKPVGNIEADIAAARATGATGTPTIVVNGRRFPTPPDSAALDAIVRKALTSGQPTGNIPATGGG